MDLDPKGGVEEVQFLPGKLRLPFLEDEVGSS